MRTLLPILLILLLSASPLAAEEPEPGQLLQVAQDDGMTLSEAIESVRGKTDGRIIRAETKKKNGREVHHIKVLTKDGKVKTYTVPGQKRGNG